MSQSPEMLLNIDPGELPANQKQLEQLFARLITQIPIMGVIDADYYKLHDAANRVQAEYAAFLKDDVGSTAVLLALGETEKLDSLVTQRRQDQVIFEDGGASREYQEIIAAGAQSLPAIAHVLDIGAVRDAQLLHKAGYSNDVMGVRLQIDDFSVDGTTELLHRAVVVILYADQTIQHDLEFKNWRPGMLKKDLPQLQVSRLHKTKTLAPGMIPLPDASDFAMISKYVQAVKDSGVADVRVNEVNQVNNLLDLVSADKGLL